MRNGYMGGVLGTGVLALAVVGMSLGGVGVGTAFAAGPSALVGGRAGSPVAGASFGAGPVGAAASTGTVATASSVGAAPMAAATSAVKGSLTGVSCPAPSFCMAAGGPPPAESLTRAGWKVLSPIIKGAGIDLTAASCVSSSFCMVVGSYGADAGANEEPVAEAWEGSAWHLSTPRLPRGLASGYLSSVSCRARDACVAVGSGGGNMVAVTWDGTAWTTRSTPLPSESTASALSSVSCGSATTCVAVGFYSITTGGVPELPLAEIWNGRAWSISLPPNPTGVGVLEGVACPSAAACITVGSTQDYYGTPSPLAESWDGKKWAITTRAGLDGGNAYFTALSCTSPKSCLAVGASHNDASLTATWDGSGWALRPSPQAGTFSSLNAVSCASANTCVGVGHYVVGNGPNMVLTASWDGSNWASPARLGG